MPDDFKLSQCQNLSQSSCQNLLIGGGQVMVMAYRAICFVGQAAEGFAGSECNSQGDVDARVATALTLIGAVPDGSCRVYSAYVPIPSTKKIDIPYGERSGFDEGDGWGINLEQSIIASANAYVPPFADASLQLGLASGWTQIESIVGFLLTQYKLVPRTNPFAPAAPKSGIVRQNWFDYIAGGSPGFFMAIGGANPYVSNFGTTVGIDRPNYSDVNAGTPPNYGPFTEQETWTATTVYKTINPPPFVGAVENPPGRYSPRGRFAYLALS